MKNPDKNPFAIILGLFAHELLSLSPRFERAQAKQRRDPRRCLATLGLLEKITCQSLDKNLPKSAPSEPVKPALSNHAQFSALLSEVASLPKKKHFFEGINQHFQRATSRNSKQVNLLQKPATPRKTPDWK